MLVWNVRGLTDESKQLLREHCRSYSPIILGIIEPKSNFHKTQPGFWHSLNLSPRHQNSRLSRRSNIWFFAQPSVVTTICFSSEQVIVAECSWQNILFRVAIIHGANDPILRRDLWRDLLQFIDGNTVFMGDFNAIKGAHERLSAVTPARGPCLEFCDFINSTGFIEPASSGLFYTWAGHRFPEHVESLLDRALVSNSFVDLWSGVSTQVLPRVTSDHSPVVFICRPRAAQRKRSFRFLNMWIDHPDFLTVVRDSWEEAVPTPCPIIKVMLKLKRLKGKLRDWNRNGFGNIDDQLATLQQELAVIQDNIAANGYNEDNFNEEVSKQAAITTILNRKNTHLQQMSRISWLKDGDRNTKFFHRMLRFRNSCSPIGHLNIGGVISYDQKAIEQHIIEHFTTLFSQDTRQNVEIVELEAIIDMQVTIEQNKDLTAIPSELEIAATVMGMEANSAPGPDGFSGIFYRHCWNIVKLDIIRAVRGFFLNSYLPHGCNANTLVLIPKTDTISSVSDLRPIILSNFFFKIISKILAVRLNKIAAATVSHNQFGFISGRSIHDCIMLGSEGFNCMNRTNHGSNMACKIDIKKAFDTMSWDFIFKVLRVMGFQDTFISWISLIFHSARISILYNGRLSGYFPCTRGVRQGDPLSPIIFGIAEDVLSHLIINCVTSRHLIPMSFSRSMNFPTHLLYADDVLLFCKASRRNAKKIKHILEYYASISGQVCSLEKSRIYFSKGVTTPMKRGISQVLGFTQGGDRVLYLGSPLFVGRPKASHLIDIKDRIVQKFSRWAGLNLSMAGRLCLVNSVIQSSIIHTMMVFRWPKSLLYDLDRSCRNFIWTGKTDLKPSCAVKWSRCCTIKEEGGLGIRSFTIMNKSYLMRMAWKLIKGEEFPHRLMRSRYLDKFGHAKKHVANSSVWVGLKHEVDGLVNHSFAEIGDGVNTLFWTDDWLGYRLCDRLSVPSYLHGLLTYSVADYYFDDCWHFSENFVLNFPEIVCDILILPMTSGPDTRFWKPSLSGNVTSALAFANSCHKFPKVSWGKWIWDAAIPVRRSLVCWRIIHDRIPTMDRLIRQGLVAPNVCPICWNDAETISHTFWECREVHQIWEVFLGWFGQSMLLNCLDITSFLAMAWNVPFSSLLHRLWKVGIISLLWIIWQSRNNAIFDDKPFSRIGVLATLKIFFKETNEVSNLGSMSNDWTDYLTIRAVGVKSRCAPPPDYISVHWWPPDINWMKVNTDGSATGAPGLIAAGGVFRDHTATVCGCFHIKGGSGFALEAELLAVVTAIAIARCRGWNRLWLEADSTYVVNLLMRRSLDVPWRFMACWKATLKRLTEMDFRISHIYREGNAAADLMAHPSRTEGWWPGVIGDIQEAVTMDMATHSHRRRV
ncbi:uncharacterized protein LOC131002988 [Salvia miltiorrhiza]|uniref:uncharacterized protein LOC131002988 n=1 Tax=Salvia miltiorrhiza TaxID=226208 RepID=UPI0025AC906E|nr:uncharacterized protein LOC131002988 [Salvia miltiorrhiza]